MSKIRKLLKSQRVKEKIKTDGQQISGIKLNQMVFHKIHPPNFFIYIRQKKTITTYKKKTIQLRNAQKMQKTILQNQKAYQIIIVKKNWYSGKKNRIHFLLSREEWHEKNYEKQ